jgi:hypothetical protein
MAKVQRHFSIHFNTRFFKGITHEEILSGIEKKVELDNVGSVQFKDVISELIIIHLIQEKKTVNIFPNIS